MEGYGSRITHHASRITFHAIRNPQSAIRNRIRYRQTEWGHTLIELLIALSVSLISLIGGLTLYRSGFQTLNVGRTSTEMQQGARKALETMVQELQETTTGTLDTSVPYAISFASARVGNGFSSKNDGTPAWKNAVVYFLDTGSSTLCRYVEAKTDWSTGFNTASAFSASNPEKLVPHVTNLQFQLVGNLLRITIETSGNVESGTISDTVTTQVYVRN